MHRENTAAHKHSHANGGLGFIQGSLKVSPGILLQFMQTAAFKLY